MLRLNQPILDRIKESLPQSASPCPSIGTCLNTYRPCHHTARFGRPCSHQVRSTIDAVDHCHEKTQQEDDSSKHDGLVSWLAEREEVESRQRK